MLPSPHHRKDKGGQEPPLDPKHSHHANSGLYCRLYCRVYVECECAQCLPLSDGKEVGQRRDPVQPEPSGSRVCVSAHMCACTCAVLCVGMCSAVCNLLPSAKEPA